jgi:hypothetical protein
LTFASSSPAAAARTATDSKTKDLEAVAELEALQAEGRDKTS